MCLVVFGVWQPCALISGPSAHQYGGLGVRLGHSEGWLAAGLRAIGLSNNCVWYGFVGVLMCGGMGLWVCGWCMGVWVYG